MVCDQPGASIKHCANRRADVYSVKQYQFKLSADLKRITARELPDFKERPLRDPKLDGPTGQKSTLRFSKEIVADNAAELKWRKKLLRLIGTRLLHARRNQDTSEMERLQKMQTELRQAPTVPGLIIRKSVLRYIALSRRATSVGIKRRLQSDRVLAVNERKALKSKLQRLDDLGNESQLFGVQRRMVARSFLEYSGKNSNR